MLDLARSPDVMAPRYRALAQQDWTFPNSNTRYGPHGLHPYPAKFIPQVPRHLLRSLYPGEDTFILDPFCGSGTTLVEAALAGCPSIGVDLNPLACLIAKVKTTRLETSLADAAAHVVGSARSNPEIPRIPRLDHWFSAGAQLGLASLVEQIDRWPEQDLRDALRIALSSIVVRVSRQESDTRYAAVDNEVDVTDVHYLFQAAADRIGKALASTWGPLIRHPQPLLLHQDILQIEDPTRLPRISLVITSPPYPNAYEYWLYHKYRMYWLGMDPLTVRKHEIGARPKYFRKNPETALDFEQQMNTVFSLLQSCLLKGGHACFQIGNSRIHGKIIDSAELLRRAARRAGFTEVLTLDREIPTHRKAFNPRNSRIRQEKILVLRLEHK